MEKKIKNWDDLWEWLCESKSFNPRDYNGNKHFLDGLLTGLECAGIITPEVSMDIWEEVQ